MDAQTQQLVSPIITRVSLWIKSLLAQSTTVTTAEQMAQLERRVRREGQQWLGSILETLVQNAVDHTPTDRACPTCGRRRRHKGIRVRGLLSSVGAIRVRGPYWYCDRCGGRHALEAVAPDRLSRPMQELLCLLGTALASFVKASAAAHKLLGVRVSEATIRRLCCHHGRQKMPEPVPAAAGSDVLGSCDGTMVHTRERGWKELRAYQFRYGSARYGHAYLEAAKTFVPRLRQAAVALQVCHARHLFWLADAAAWIDKGVSQQLPMAIRIIDLWHAYQHVYTAAQGIYAYDESQMRRWAKRHCRVLKRQGARGLLKKLELLRYTHRPQRQALKQLRRYLDKHADHLAYPSYLRQGYPISSGPMESFCKQLGQRLKGPGMRWSRVHVTPMATLVSLWANGQWDRYWQHAA